MDEPASGPSGTDSPRHNRTSRRRRRHFILSLEAFFAERSPAFVVLASILLIGVIFSADVATGRELSPSFFYLLPVALMTWRLGRGGGVVAAAMSSFSWTLSDIVTRVYAGNGFAPWWNAAGRFGMLLVVTSLLATLSEAMQDERDAADEAIRAAEQLRGLNDVKDTLLHAVAHDLRGPIAAIVGSAQSLDRRIELQLGHADVDTLVDGVLQSGKKLDRMVADLLDLERLDRGLVEPHRVPIELGALIGHVVDEAMYADRHPIHMEVLEAIEMDIDAGTMERVIDNLLVNAVKHTPERTSIHVRAERCDGGAMISVEDEGPGVPDELKAAIFEPFRQGAGVRSGAGIGLSLVARFAELHGGRAWAEDRPGGGAAFRVYLPGEVRTAPRSSATAAARV